MKVKSAPGFSVLTFYPLRLRTPVRLFRSRGSIKTEGRRFKHDMHFWVLGESLWFNFCHHPAMGNNVSGISALHRSQQQGFHRLRNSQKGQWLIAETLQAGGSFTARNRIKKSSDRKCSGLVPRLWDQRSGWCWRTAPRPGSRRRARCCLGQKNYEAWLGNISV